MKEVDFTKVAQVQGEYEIPTIEEQEVKGKIAGKICFDERSMFCDTVGESFKDKVAEIIQKRYPQASVMTDATDGAFRCATYVVSAIDKDDVRKVSNLHMLEKQGYKDLGSGVYKKANELWSLKVDTDGGYNVVRSNAEDEFGRSLDNQEVLVTKRVDNGDIEALSMKEVASRGWILNETDGKIVNGGRDNVGTILFILEASSEKKAGFCEKCKEVVDDDEPCPFCGNDVPQYNEDDPRIDR
jgi:hypothetical protein